MAPRVEQLAVEAVNDTIANLRVERAQHLLVDEVRQLTNQRLAKDTGEFGGYKSTFGARDGADRHTDTDVDRPALPERTTLRRIVA